MRCAIQGRATSITSKLHVLLAALAFLAGVCPAPAQPTLRLSLSNSQSVFAWPISFTNYTLQTTTNPASTNWVTISNPAPQPVGSNFTVILTNNLSRSFFRLLGTNATIATPGVALVPAGDFTIGDPLDNEFDAIPTATVYVSGFYMDKNLITYTQWVNIYSWATNHGYEFTYNFFVNEFFDYKGPDYPAIGISWYDAVKWCNARSQSAGLRPVYYVDAGLTELYYSGNVDEVYADWSSKGYRLPTEAEWEKAARGGLSGYRFPWGDLISETNANYVGSTNISYDLGPPGDNPLGTNTTTTIYTTIVGTFAPNGYGLTDMAGNVYEWCWDWYDPPPYPEGSPYLGGTDPRGPDSSTLGYRTARGGSYTDNAVALRCASRLPTSMGANVNVGFRCVSTK